MTLPPETLAAATPSPPETTPMEDNKLIEQKAREIAATQFEEAGCFPADVEAIRYGKLDGDEELWLRAVVEALSPSNTRSTQEVEEDGRPASGQPCHSAEPEPVPVSALAGECQAHGLEAALKRLLGPPEDPNVGWRGYFPTKSDHLSCEFCRAEHLDLTQIAHAGDCPVSLARAALAAHQAQKICVSLITVDVAGDRSTYTFSNREDSDAFLTFCRGQSVWVTDIVERKIATAESAAASVLSRFPSDSGRHRNGEDASAAESEACQSGHRPNTSTPTPQIDERAAIVAWQPIESAPRDGTTIDIWFPTSRSGETGRREANVCWNRWDGFWMRPDRTHCIYGYSATHWMPLPPPPGEHTTALPTVAVDGLVERLQDRFTGLRPGAHLMKADLELIEAAIAALSRTMGGGSGG